MNEKEKRTSFVTSLLAGATAGTTVDVALFPLDTIKTRMQSSQGFLKAGGFRGVYSGLLAAAGGSAPSAAVFFAVYDVSKGTLNDSIQNSSKFAPLIHMTSAGLGETMACLVRVPTDNVKQKMQAGIYKSTTATIKAIIGNKGISGFYTGYFTTIMRDIPFALIQLPLYEKAKKVWGNYQKREVSPLQAAICGMVSGGFSAGITTPVDVVKTRLMLGTDSEGKAYNGARDTFRRIYYNEGFMKFFSGIKPRVLFISIGGAFFLELMKLLKNYFKNLDLHS